MTKKFRLEGQMLLNDRGELIGMFPENTSTEEKAIIKNSAEAISLIQDFVTDVNENGVYKPRTHVKKFETFLEKIKE